MSIENPQHIAGTRKNPDGSLDYSHAPEFQISKKSTEPKNHFKNEEEGQTAKGKQKITEIRKDIELEVKNSELRTFYNPANSKKNNENTTSRESKTTLLLLNKRLINGNSNNSGGGFGTVYAVDVQIPGKDKTYPFALKESHGYMSSEEAISNTRNSIINHRMAKKAGLRVWKTFRIGDDEKSILMSTGNTEESKLVGNNTLDEKEKVEFLPILNFNVFLENYYKDAEKAAKNKISIAGDVPFFRIGKNNMDFILGDMDQLEISTKDENKILEENLQNMHSRLVVFFEDNFGEFDEDAEVGSAGDTEVYIKQSNEYIAKNFNQSVTRYNA